MQMNLKKRNLSKLCLLKTGQHVQNKTNTLEGGVFSHMKNLISLHRGITQDLKLK